ncbi:MAG: flavin-containing monooxygenase [Aestuariivirga sp.]
MPSAASTRTARSWLLELEKALRTGDPAAAAKLFGKECYWRDLLAFTWNIRTMEGQDEIRRMLAATLPHVGLRSIEIDGPAKRVGEITEAWFRFESAVARGIGHLRLKGGNGYTLLTTMQELKGHEEKQGPSREKGLVHGAFRDRKAWHEERAREQAELGITRQPYCLIVGGGQGGIALAARLKRLGVDTLVVEKNPRAGDSWRNRYRTLVLHDPVWYDHLPYIPFPAHWPVFCPKDKMGDWLEMYVKVMELDYWTSSTCQRASFDENSKTWTVTIDRGGHLVTLKPQQLVFATGSYGPPREPAINGQERFKGAQYHSSRHVTSAPFKGKRCIVVGANSSAHDICADMWEHDADVTMIQRTPTTVVRSETLMDVAFKGLYSEEALANGISVDRADLIFASMPFRLMPDVQRPLYAEMAKRDGNLIERLNKAGFLTDYGEDGSGLMMKALRTGSGYYIDVGCSELIASGEVKVRSRVEIAKIAEDRVILTDGSELDADVIVYATGYRPMNEWLASIISRETADRVGPNWGYGSGTRGDPGPWEGELRNMWKPLKQEALWFHGGNLHLSRHYSQFVALQIKARKERIPAPVY